MSRPKLPKRLFKSADRVSSYHDQGHSAGKLRNRMARDHSDVLQNIEFALVNLYREGQGFDDRAAATALRSLLSGKETDDPKASQAVDALHAMRAFREDVAQDVWRDGLQVILDSVKLHSEQRPGQTSYLRFVAEYVR